MPTGLSITPVIAREDLVVLAEARLREAEVLRANEHYAASIYLAGLAVECCLKAAICKTLDWNELLGVFKTHDLEGLLKYSGFDRQLRANSAVLESFSRINKAWSGNKPKGKGHEPGVVRYSLPDEYDKRDADDFFRWVADPSSGVIPWLRSRLS